MSYLVLARKYRPQTFEEIVGQEHVTRTLAGAIAQGRIHHAFLFCGARGVGKTTAARILAKCLSCERAPTATPCNECVACREITAGTSVDVQEIDGASNNSVDDVRTLREGVRYLPVRGKKKVYIIDEVHMLSSGAFNALLKTLEEPPPHALFIFATTEVHKIPITILSRVQRYDFRLVATPRIVQHLEKVLVDEKIGFEPGALQVVAREAAGSVRDALSLLEQVLAHAAAESDGTAPVICTETAAAEALGVADRSLVLDVGRAILAKDAAAALSLVGAASERNVDVKHLSHALLEHLRDLVVARVVKDPRPLVEASEGELAALVDTARAAPEGLLPLLFDRFSRAVEEIAKSPLPRFALEVALVELCHVEPLEPIGDLIDRLEALETRLESPGARPAPAPRAQPAAAPSTPRAPAPSSAAPSSVSSSAPSSVAVAAARAVATPAAALAPPVAAGPTPRNWNELANTMAGHDGKLAALFLHGEEVEFAPPRIAVAFEVAFDVERARDKAADASRLASTILGTPVRVEVQQGRGKAPSANQAEEQRAREERERRVREAKEHPARKLVAETFGEGTRFNEPEID